MDPLTYKSMRPRGRYKKIARGHKVGPGWAKIVLIGWFIKSPLKFIRVLGGILLFIFLVGYDLVGAPWDTPSDPPSHNIPHRSY